MTSRKSRAKWTRQERLQFTVHLATLKGSGIPIHRALASLAEQQGDSPLGAQLAEMERRILGGAKLSETCKAFPEMFTAVDVAMIRLGEDLGLLDVVLYELSRWQEFDSSLHRRLVTSLTYPLAVLGVSAILTLLLMATAVPQFLSVFADLQAELPWNTRLLLTISQALGSPLFWCFLAVVVYLAVDWLKNFARTESGGVTLAQLVLSIPSLGELVQVVSTARYASALAMILENGGSLERALPLAADASKNPAIAADAPSLVKAILDGGALSDHLISRPDLYHPILAQMIAVGEATSRTPALARWATVFLDEVAARQTDAISKAIEPAALAFTAGVVGFVLFSVLLPIYQQLGTLAP